MKMPDGWKRWKENGPNGIARFDRETFPDINIALELMKEMAEALQAYAADSFDATSLGDHDEEGHGKLARSVLKKFKEWK